MIAVSATDYRDYHTVPARSPGLRGAAWRTMQGAMRPGWDWAQGARGQAGATHMLKTIEAEMQVAMSRTCMRTIAEINETTLSRG